jgi:hypothetical protein
MVPMKVCNTCGNEKTLTQFYKSANNTDGREGRCKTCRRKALQQRHATDAAPVTKHCPKCHQEKPAAAFYKNQQQTGGLSSYCKVCSGITAVTQARQDRTRHAAKGRRWRKEHPDDDRAIKHQYRYGLTQAQFEALWTCQQGRCAICGKALVGTYHVDHDHGTGCIRGLLCPGCNLGIGHFRDDPAALRSAAAYIEANRAKN